MIDGVRLKVCGIRTRAEAEAAAGLGADFLGFILYPASPRYLPLESFATVSQGVSGPAKVAVCVTPTAAELAAVQAAGFDRFQVHFRADTLLATVASWAETVGVDRLWLAPKLLPAADLPAGLRPLAETFLLDTFDPDKFGGTGRTGDWGKFARHQRAHPEKTWVLSGGLGPENIRDALQLSGARVVDVNSGVESAPGVKDLGKLQALVRAMAARGGTAGQG